MNCSEGNSGMHTKGMSILEALMTHNLLYVKFLMGTILEGSLSVQVYRGYRALHRQGCFKAALQQQITGLCESWEVYRGAGRRQNSCRPKFGMGQGALSVGSGSPLP